MNETETQSSPIMTDKKSSPAWVFLLILLYILLAAAYFRFSGIYWGEYQYLHPDERFLVWVGSDISPVKSLGEYFDTANSSLNPHNRGHGFYVYGTLPMFITRYVVEWIFGQSGFMEMTKVGRILSSAADLFTILLVYLVAARLYNRRVALLASAFSAAAVLQIQQSHFFTMDTFLVAFSLLAFYFAVLIVTVKDPRPTNTQNERDPQAAESAPPDSLIQEILQLLKDFSRDALFLPSLGFGLALGLAVASKLDAALMAFVLPIAMLIYLTRVPHRQQARRLLFVIGYLILAALVSILTFRLFQPYAFSGPGFFGLQPNPLWLENIRSLLAQSGGDVDFPPAMQWARRSHFFSLQNLVLWGLGLPLGLLSCFGFLWVGWRLLTTWKTDRRQWQSHALIWSWTALYFVYQSIRQNATMRYQLPIYPTLAILAAWAVFALYDLKRSRAPSNGNGKQGKPILWAQVSAVTIGAVVLFSTFLYAYTFSQIYTRSITRVEASRWIYQNIPGPVSLPIQTESGVYNQSISVPYSFTLTPGYSLTRNFSPKEAGTLAEVYLPQVSDENGSHETRQLTLTISSVTSPDGEIASASLSEDLTPQDGMDAKSLRFQFENPIEMDPEASYSLNLTVSGEQAPASTLDGSLVLYIQPVSGETPTHTIELTSTFKIISPETPYITDFTPDVDGVLTHMSVVSIANQNGSLPNDLKLSLEAPDTTLEDHQSNLAVQEVPGGQGYLLVLEKPLPVLEGEEHLLSLEKQRSGPAITLSGSAIANEGEWDDGLPLRMDGYDGYGGIYPQSLNMNMYWDDNPDKLERFVDILTQAEYLTFSSSRQWGSLPRIPERFPMTTIYYRQLLGCPPEQTIEYCYNVAEPGTYQGGLGFELEKVFTSNPQIGGLSLNDQFAEEAFTVYDHPKVFIFKKTSDFDPDHLRQVLAQADFSKIIRKPPMQYESYPETLMLPDFRLDTQRQGGTWSQLFNTDALINRSQPLAVLLWYLSVSLLGLIAYPLLRLAAPGLDDRAYPLARIAGLLILSYLVWLASSFRVPFSQTTISLVLLLLGLLSAVLAYHQRAGILQELRQRRNYFLFIEGLALVLFLAFLFIRFGNPDLWHPWKGGEKPMDFAYFNAVLKSSSFPPFDPWYSGGYLNYYYYGFVLVGVLAKWLGIVPAVAYNLIIPTLFSMIALGAFSIAWNLSLNEKRRAAAETEKRPALPLAALIPALSAALGMAVLGNLGTVRMFFQGYQKLVAPGGIIEDANLVTRWIWVLRGFFKQLGGARLPYGIGDWYWLPSRAIPAAGDIEPITEFPYFSVLYADLHAHLLALPLTLLALGLAVAFIFGRARWKNGFGAGLWFVLAGITIGSLRPTNTWDLPTYLVIGLVAVGYTLWVYYRPSEKLLEKFTALKTLPESTLRLLVTLGGMALLFGLVLLFFKPYTDWYALGYNKIRIWEGTRTPLSAYLTHWGLFLFVIITWMVSETIDWMAKTPLSALRKLSRYRGLIMGILVTFLLVIVFLSLPDVFQVQGEAWPFKVPIAWFVIPLAAWAGVLLLRPDISDAKRLLFFLIGSGLFFTLMVEVTVFVGDIGRMNWVFKFYLQVWTMFAISAGVALGWLIKRQNQWEPWLRNTWSIVLTLLLFGTALYPLIATMAKVEDRMDPRAPHTLDGMAYMPYAQYTERWGAMDLVQDYNAIRWLQENVQGSPVIVEANLRDLYRWGSRFSIYTGLPSVAGWEWHQQQQRAVNPGSWVSERITETDNFYLTPDWESAADFLRKYDVRYIMVGQQERGHYNGSGLNKFEEAEGILWREVYRDADTVIYEVLVE